MLMYKCVIVDDEPHAIDGLKRYIDKVPYLKVVGSFTNPLAALDAIKGLGEIDLLLLDVDMPEISGIELATLVRDRVDKLVLTTAHPKYGYDGFQVRADGYLLKPFSLVRFIEIMDRLFSSRKNEEIIAPSPKEIHKTDNEFFFIKSKDDNLKLVKIRFTDLVAAESKLNYVQLSTSSGRTILTYMSLSDMGKYLTSENGFIKFQRSFILNISRIEGIDGNTVTMDNGQQVTVGDYYKKDFNEFVFTHLIKPKKRSQK